MKPIARTLKSTGDTVWGVRWVIGGGRASVTSKRESATFTEERDALRFILDVEDAGYFWPKGWKKDEYGYVVREDQVGPQHPTMTDVATKFLTRQLTRIETGRIKSYTVHRYEQMWDTHLKPFFGSRDFTSIDVEDVEDWIVEQTRAGAKPKSIRNRHGLLFSIMKHGELRLHLRQDNPCEATELPERTDGAHKQELFFRPEEWRTFRPLLDPDIVLMCDLMLATGMRAGEALALQAGDIRVNGDADISVHIRRAWSKRGPHDKNEIKWHLGETQTWKIDTPKNGKSHWAHVKGSVAEDVIEAIRTADPGGWMFTSRNGTPWRYQDFHENRWKPAQVAMRKLGHTKNFTPHMLRHSFVVWALEGGKDLYQVSTAVGHSGTAITDQVYSGHFDPTRNSVADVISARMDSLLVTGEERGGGEDETFEAS